LISDAVQKFGRLADIKLYVAGHTDTVGAKDYNRGLSLNRARSICAYFRREGLRIPIFYEGFGEEALLVGTPDETDEPRNRRAEYIIAIDKPSVAHAPYEANWKKL
jgi:outer membrane protein OmpA-like peptidoglycan-associated protein